MMEMEYKGEIEWLIEIRFYFINVFFGRNVMFEFFRIEVIKVFKSV